MKRLLIILGILVISLGAYAQESTNPSLLRSSKAVKALNTVPYLHMAFQDSTEVIAITDDVWYLITNGDSTLWTSTAQRVTVAGDTATISIAGDYVATLAVNYIATASDTIHIRLVKNHSTAYVPEATEISIGTENHTLVLPVLLPNLVVGDDIKPQIMNSASSDDCTILGGSLVMYLIRYD